MATDAGGPRIVFEPLFRIAKELVIVGYHVITRDHGFKREYEVNDANGRIALEVRIEENFKY